jgi:uncharacterized membrane protein YkoI
MLNFQIFKFVALAFGVALAMPAFADNDKQDVAREAMLAGEVAPLSQLLSVVERSYQGDVLKVEMEHEDTKKWGGTGDGKMFIYEIKLLTFDGNLVKLKYDAKSLKLLATNLYDDKDGGKYKNGSDDQND